MGSKGTPRLALHLMSATYRVSRSEAADRMTLEHLARAVEVEGLDELGLDQHEQALLHILAEANGKANRHLFPYHLSLSARRGPHER